jgi:Calx-beta domain
VNGCQIATKRRRLGALAALVLGVALASPLDGGAPRAGAAADFVEVVGTCTLAEAILSVNVGQPTPACSDHEPGSVRIVLSAASGSVVPPGGEVAVAGVGFDLASAPAEVIGGARTALPAITRLGTVIEGTGASPVGIFGLESARIDGRFQPGARLLYVHPQGGLTLKNITVGGGSIRGTAAVDTCEGVPGPLCTVDPGGDVLGGAVFAEGPLALDGVTMYANTARGGAGVRYDSLGAFVAGNSSLNRLVPHLAEGGFAAGGAVFAAGPLTVASSVFDRNAVEGGSEGGGAHGGAIALGPTSDATLTDVVFSATGAYGGNGSPGADGANGGSGGDGRNGVCDDDNESAADGGSGWDGPSGRPGAPGGPGGDATGVVSGGRDVTIVRGAAVGSVALAGTAGRGGVGGIGGDGGNGGNGLQCGSSFFGFGTAWKGTSGNAGNAGDNGASGEPGRRGVAIATFDVAGTLALTNVTIAGASAIVPADRYRDGETASTWQAKYDDVQRRVGRGGVPGNGPLGLGAFPTKLIGSTDSGYPAREQASPAGGAAGFDFGSSSRVTLAYSTLADITVATPATSQGRSQSTTRVLTNAGAPAGGTRGSVLWNPDSPSGGCPLLVLAGGSFNVSDDGCVGAGTGGLVVGSRPVAEQWVGSGAELRPAVNPGDAPYLMPVLPLRGGSPAMDITPIQATPGCTAVGGAVIAVDARLQPRDLECDAGAFEFDASILTFTGPDQLYLDDIRGGTLATVHVNVNPGPSTVRVTVRGLSTGTVFFAPWQLDPPVPFESSASVVLTGNETYPLNLDFSLFAETGSQPFATVDAQLNGVGPGQVTVSASVPVVNDSRLVLTASAPDTWSPCRGYLPITYTATSVGRSPVRPATVEVGPRLVDPLTADLVPPPGDSFAVASVGSIANHDFVSGQVTWQTPRFTADDAPFTLTTFVAVGAYNGRSVAVPGDSLTASARWTFTGDNRVRQAAGLSTTRIVNDLDILDGLASDHPGTVGEYTVGAGQTANVFLATGEGECAAPARGAFDVAYGLDVFDMGLDPPMSLTSGPLARAARIGGSNPDNWDTVAFTAPTEPGFHVLEFRYDGVGNDAPVVRTVRYRVNPEVVVATDAGSAPESDTTRTFTVGLLHAYPVPLSVHYETVAATAGTADFVPTAGDVTFAPGQTSATVDVTVEADTLVEADEIFAMRLSSGTTRPLPDTVRLGRTQVFAQITDDDAAAVSIADTAGAEGTGTDTRSMAFTVSLDQPAPAAVTVDVATAAGTASSDDFTQTATPVTFAPGETTQVVTVPLTADSTPEVDETFTATLSNATGATIDAASATATIIDDDTWVIDGADDVRAAEGDPPPATTPVAVTLTLNAPAPAGGFLVDWTTVDGTATAPGDYLAASGTATIPAGATSVVVHVEVVNDTAAEPTESFSIRLTGLRLADGVQSRSGQRMAGVVDLRLQAGAAALITITDTDPTPGTVPGTTEPPPGTPTSITVPGAQPPNPVPTAPIPGQLPTTGGDPNRVGEIGAAAVLIGLLMTAARRRRAT